MKSIYRAEGNRTTNVSFRVMLDFGKVFKEAMHKKPGQYIEETLYTIELAETLTVKLGPKCYGSLFTCSMDE